MGLVLLRGEKAEREITSSVVYCFSRGPVLDRTVEKNICFDSTSVSVRVDTQGEDGEGVKLSS